MNGLRVCLFGQFRVQYGEQDLTGLCQRKVQELFCYLLLFRDQVHSRESLAGLFWGDSTTAQSKKCLRQALWQLQAVFRHPAERDQTPLLLTEPDLVRLNPEAELWLDVAEFQQAFANVQGRAGRELDDHRAQALRAAVELYQGDLLEGWYQDWCLYWRECLQNSYLAMLDKLMGYCEAHQQYEAGLAYGSSILRYDRARERTHRHLMWLHYLDGDRTGALRQYQRCVDALQEELSIRPSSRTAALYEQIRADRLVSPLPGQTESSAVPVGLTSSLREALGHLMQFLALLGDARQQVQQDIEAVERAMDTPR